MAKLLEVSYNLRPIGTEFEIDLGVDPFSTDPRGRKTKYKITAYQGVCRFPGDEVGELREKIEAVETEYYDIDPCKYCWRFIYG